MPHDSGAGGGNKTETRLQKLTAERGKPKFVSFPFSAFSSSAFARGWQERVCAPFNFFCLTFINLY